MKALIVDDETKARSVLKELLAEFDATIEVVAQANDIPSAVKAIHQYKPDVVFLDIEMPGYNGFQLLEFFDKVDFKIVFTTAYSEYAVQAFEISAVDYLLKPIQISQLERTIGKLQSLQPLTDTDNKQMEVLKQAVSGKKVSKLALPAGNSILFIDIQNILYLEADGSYTRFHLQVGDSILVSKVMKEYEPALLSNGNFYRVHRSYIVNTDKVKKIVRNDGGYLVMENEQQIPISREQRDNVYALLVG
jgi:two-component system LytT family response regulator